MNSQIRKLAIIAFAAALPLGLAAQSGSTGSSPSGSSNSTSGSSRSTSSSDTLRSGSSTGSSMTGSSRDQSSSTRGTSGSGMSSPSTSTGSVSGSSGADYSSSSGSSSSSALHGISRVDQNSIKQQFTATDLIGQEVYDNSGKKVGEVKDLVLGSAAASHLAMAFANRGGADDATSSSSSLRSGRSTSGATGGSAGGTYGSTSGAGSTGSATGASGTGSTSRIAGTDRASSTRDATGSAGSSTLGSEMSSAFNSMSGMASEPAAIVSLGGFMGMGDSLVRVPLSQLNYDSSNERLTIAVSESELSSLTDRTHGRNAAE